MADAPENSDLPSITPEKSVREVDFRRTEHPVCRATRDPWRVGETRALFSHESRHQVTLIMRLPGKIYVPICAAMPLLTIAPPMPGAERRFKPFVDFVQAAGWEAEFVRLDWPEPQPSFGSTALFPQVEAQTAGKVVMGFSLGALYSHLGALRARRLILGSISPFFLEDDDEPQRWSISYRAGNADTPAEVLVGALEDEQMHRRATAVRDFYRQSRYTVVPGAEHELWHPNYLSAIKAALDRAGS